MTYAVSVCLHTCSVPEVGVRGRRAAPAVGCRVGGSSGNDHVIGRVWRLLSEVTTWPVTKTHRKHRWGCARTTWRHLCKVLRQTCPFKHLKSVNPSESAVLIYGVKHCPANGGSAHLGYLSLLSFISRIFTILSLCIDIRLPMMAEDPAV